ncbi:ABC transporter ATP-binding protein [Cocleimonas flava]|uniref:Probable ATP-binding protein YheS n=1 Tax=Cocleimonas flava TaxID=634765 RepID=A0A4R1EUN3_9GAMM|nr:ATP-binding cassette domain-containing protein [Cocleimonas flava]TCJ82808.1 ATP-binding cassette subfamily F protein 3 [Cocleimonas flava]
MIVLSDVTLRRGPQKLLSDVSISVHPGYKVGLTGANGTGKSSLFAMLRGELGQDEGTVSIPPNWVVAHVAQETPATTISALQYALQGDTEYIDLHKQLEDAEGALLGELHGRLDAIDGYTTESRAATLLHGLGFSQEQINNPVDSFSGGWRMRLNLAQALMCRSDLLLLDEPTNHLDLDAVIWLQSWLVQYEGTLILISHDREFLDAVVKHVAHIEHAKVTLYTGNYTAFEKIRAERLAQQQSAYEKQQREKAHMQKYVDRFRAQATKAKQAQSRLKALGRMEEISAAQVDSPFHFKFFDPEKLPERLLNVVNASIGYGDKIIVKNVKMQLMPGQRIGLIGPNGAGKSTLIKYLAGELQSIATNTCEDKEGDKENKEDESWEAQDLKIGYFAQHQLEQLRVDLTALQQLRALDKEAREQDLRNYLGGFGFKGERVDEPVEPFSGGEKARLVLALLVYQKPNLLLLDEPTNHLDLQMRHALSVALQGFAGAMVIVSHDRHLLKTVTDELVIVHDGKAEEFDGDLDDYAKFINESNKQLASASKEAALGDNQDDSEKGLSKKEQRQLEAQRRKQLQPLLNQLKKAEKELDDLSTKQAELEKQLSDPDIYQEENKQKLKSLVLDKSELDKKLEAVEMQWMEISEEYESAAAQIV